MQKSIKLIKCFIASPSDVADERSRVKKIIETLNPVFMERGLHVEPIMWENNAVPAIGGDAQEIINTQLKPAENDILIGIFGTRLGSPTPRAESGTAEEVRCKEITCRDLNFMSIPKPASGDKIPCQVKVRYRHAGQPALLEMIGEDRVRITFDEPVRSAAPGQSAVFYDENDCVIGGGVIEP